jgi:hypothetical protein
MGKIVKQLFNIPKRRHHLGDKGIDGRIILKMYLK